MSAQSAYWLVLHCPACGHAHGFDARWTMTSREPLNIAPSHRQTGANGSCHINVQAGKIHFAPDSTHAMAGQVVDVDPSWIHFGASED